MNRRTKHVYLFAALDTKAAEAAFLREQLRTLGVHCRLVDTGSLNPPAIAPDVSREQLFAAAGTTTGALRDRGDRGYAVTLAAQGAARLVADAHEAGEVAGVLGIGGSAGTIIGTAAMRALPVGVPKLMVSTLVAGQIRQYVGEKDICMLPSLVDMSGINRVSRQVLGTAARAMAGMVTLGGEAKNGDADDRPVVAMTMFGVTTPCVARAREIVEEGGYEVLIFHATGTGGRMMESLIGDGLVAGVLDITTTELADELCGGFLSAGPDRLTGAGKAGIPQVVSVGATDMVNFYGPETVPPAFQGRRFHQHDPQVTLMRTTAAECARIGAEIARRLQAARGPVTVFLPARGVSALDRAGKPFDDPEARQALFAAVKNHDRGLDVVELDLHINDSAFAEAAARRLLAHLAVSQPKGATKP